MKKVKMIITIAVITFALVFNLQYAFDDYGMGTNSGFHLFAQTNSGSTGGTGGTGGSGMGCYNTQVLQCWIIGPINLGEASVCNFTGVYGAPYRCTEYGCGSSTVNRTCVRGV